MTVCILREIRFFFRVVKPDAERLIVVCRLVTSAANEPTRRGPFILPGINISSINHCHCWFDSFVGVTALVLISVWLMMLGLSSASANLNESSLLPSLALHDAFFCKLSDMMVPSKKKPTAMEAAASTTARPPIVVDRKSNQKPDLGQPKANGNAAGKKRKNTAEQISKIAKRAREGGLQQHSKEDETLTNSDAIDPTNIITINSTQQEKNVQLDIDMTSSSSAPQGSHIESLREKLMKKIESLRVQRQNTLPDGSTSGDGNIMPSQPTHNGISKRAARRQLIEQRRQIATTKAKANHTTSADASSSPKPFVDNTTLLRKLSHVISASTSSTTQTTTTTPTVPEDLSGIDFGTLTGLASSHSTSIKDNKSLVNIGKKKSLESLLTEAEKKKARLKELKQSEQAEDQQRATQMEWKETLMLARYVY